MSLDCWKCSPMCWTVRPVTDIYEVIMTCSSSMTCFELQWPISHSSSRSARKTSLCISSLQWIWLGWPLRSSLTHWCLDNTEVWYGMRVLNGMGKEVISIKDRSRKWMNFSRSCIMALQASFRSRPGMLSRMVCIWVSMWWAPVIQSLSSRPAMKLNSIVTAQT